jgi:hypothetical protein
MENFSYIANGSKGRITSPFGERMHPVSKKWKKHHGLDIAHPTGTEVLAMADGVVIDSQMTNNACGGTIAVDHGNINGKKIKTRFCHNSKLLKNKGDTVKKGDVIAISGGGRKDVGRGTSTGPHIHFEVYENGSPVNPKPYYDGSIKINSQDIEDDGQLTTTDSKPELSQTKKSDFEDIMKYLTTDTSKMTNQEKNKALMPLLSMLGLNDLRSIMDKPELTGDLKNQDEVKKELGKILAMNEEIKRFKRLII